MSVNFLIKGVDTFSKFELATSAPPYAEFPLGVEEEAIAAMLVPFVFELMVCQGPLCMLVALTSCCFFS